MDGNWVEYVPDVRRPGRSEAVAILGKGGSLRLTPAAVELIGNPGHVVLLFDRRGRRVGIRVANNEIRHAFPLKRYGGGTMWNVSFGGFLKWADISYEQRRDFAVQRLDEETLVIELGDAKDELGEFEEFTFKSVAIAQLAPNVSISRNGNMTMNLATKKLLGDADRLILLYNETERLIGLRPAKSEDLHARPLRQAATQRTWTLSAEGFPQTISNPS